LVKNPRRKTRCFQSQANKTMTTIQIKNHPKKGMVETAHRTRQLYKGEKEINLTRTEGSILQQLMRNAGQVVSYHSLAEAVWGEDYSDATDSLRVYVRRLREKMEVEPSKPQIILTKSSIGYLLVKPD